MKKLLSAALALTMLSGPALAIESFGTGRGFEPARQGSYVVPVAYDDDDDDRREWRQERREWRRDRRNDRRERRYEREYCRRDSNTGGTILGAAAGGLLGNTVAKRGDKTLGTVVGGVLGGVIGNQIDDQNRCR